MTNHYHNRTYVQVLESPIPGSLPHPAQEVPLKFSLKRLKKTSESSMSVGASEPNPPSTPHEGNAVVSTSGDGKDSTDKENVADLPCQNSTAVHPEKEIKEACEDGIATK